MVRKMDLCAGYAARHHEDAVVHYLSAHALCGRDVKYGWGWAHGLYRVWHGAGQPAYSGNERTPAHEGSAGCSYCFRTVRAFSRRPATPRTDQPFMVYWWVNTGGSVSGPPVGNLAGNHWHQPELG